MSDENLSTSGNHWARLGFNPKFGFIAGDGRLMSFGYDPDTGWTEETNTYPLGEPQVSKQSHTDFVYFWRRPEYTLPDFQQGTPPMTISSAISRLRTFRQSFEDGQICEESGLTTEDLDLVLEAPKDPVAVYRMPDATGEVFKSVAPDDGLPEKP